MDADGPDSNLGTPPPQYRPTITISMEDLRGRTSKVYNGNPQTGASNGEGEKAVFLPKVDIELNAKSKPDMDEDEFWTDSEEENEADEDVKIVKQPCIARCIMAIQKCVTGCYAKLLEMTRGYLMKSIVLLCYLVYFIYAMIYRFGDEGSHRLLGFTILGIIIMTASYIKQLARWIFKKIYGSTALKPAHREKAKTIRFFSRWLIYGILTGVVVYVLVEEGRQKPKNLRSLPGLLLFVLIPLMFSSNPGRVNWHTVFMSIAMQFIFAVVVLKVEKGKDVVLWVQARLDEFFANTEHGSKLLFGDSYKDHYMIFGALPIIFFTNASLTILYYLGAIQYVINVVGSLLTFMLDTSPTESMAVAGGIFMEGVTAILALRPYLGSLSKSQLFVVITSAFASLGGAYLAILSSLGISLEYLIPAMVVSAPATFAVCKVMMPETKWSKEADKGRQGKAQLEDDEKQKYAGIMDAAQTGAVSMLAVVGNIVVVAFSFFAYIGWVNNTLTWFGDRVGIEKLTIELISSYLLYPVALMMGIDTNDCRNVAMLLGYRIGINNIIAFIQLNILKINRNIYTNYMIQTNFTGPVRHGRDDIYLEAINVTLTGGFISERSEAIVTYSLCGFSSFLSVVMTMGIMVTLIPRRRRWINNMVIPALLAGNIANCMTGCFASIFY